MNMRILEKNIYEIELNLPYVHSIYEYLVDFHLNLLSKDYEYKNINHNFLVVDNDFSNFFNSLYKRFFFESLKIFGNFNLTESNSTNCWAQVSNMDNKKGKELIHNHLNTSVINGVYYFSVPDKNSGLLNFCDEEGNEFLSYQPKQDYLLIFPNYLNHYPETCNSKNYRIAINMEIKCKENIWKL